MQGGFQSNRIKRRIYRKIFYPLRMDSGKHCRGFRFAGFIVATMGLLGIICATCATVSCDFFSYYNEDAEQPAGHLPRELMNATYASMGLFRFQVLETTATLPPLTFYNFRDPPAFETTYCKSYSSARFRSDRPYLLIAQFCSIVAPLLGLFSVFLQLCGNRQKRWHECEWRCGSVLLLAAMMGQMGTFAILFETSFCFDTESGTECQLDAGGFYAIGALVSFFLAFLLSLICRDPDEEDEEQQENFAVKNIPKGASHEDQLRDIELDRNPFDVNDSTNKVRCLCHSLEGNIITLNQDDNETSPGRKQTQNQLRDELTENLSQIYATEDGNEDLTSENNDTKVKI